MPKIEQKIEIKKLFFIHGINLDKITARQLIESELSK